MTIADIGIIAGSMIASYGLLGLAFPHYWHDKRHIIGCSSGVLFNNLFRCSCGKYIHERGFERSGLDSIFPNKEVDVEDIRRLKCVVNELPKEQRKETLQHIDAAAKQFGLF